MSISGHARVMLVGVLMGSVLFSAASPGLSKEKRSARCPHFNPVVPETKSQQADAVPNTEVLTVQDKMTQADPLVIEFDQGVSLWSSPPSNPMGPSEPILEDTKFFNVQVATRRPVSVLNAKLIWDSPFQLSDFDEFLYNSEGREVDRSDSPTGPQESVELVSVSARNCDGFTVEARGYRTWPTSAALQIWLSSGGSKG